MRANGSCHSLRKDGENRAWCCVEFWRMRRVVFSFFFSSRRRHTRLQGDWSSDVCSSDLRHHPIGVETRQHLTTPIGPDHFQAVHAFCSTEAEVLSVVHCGHVPPVGRMVEIDRKSVV